ncbi:MAG: AAA family ATPase [Candidatus Anammoxibacter sp.]
MKIKVENLGPLRQAEFEIADFTIICGKNNMGKTYATYALYGFLNYWEKGFRFEIDKQIIDEIVSKGNVVFSLDNYRKKMKEDIDMAASNYEKYLPSIFASKEQNFKKTIFNLELSETYGSARCDYLESRITFGSEAKSFLQITQTAENELKISLLKDGDDPGETPPFRLIADLISDAIKEVIYSKLIPNAFISSAERTGAAIFQKELDFNKNKIIELLKEDNGKFHPFQLLKKFTSDYALPVKDNVGFTRELENVSNRESFVSKNFPDVLSQFSKIIGGEYKVTKNLGVFFVPDSNKALRLTLNESSSTVRSMLDIGFYLRHVAKEGDLLIVDEPELNLHPENQRLIARLFARLVNIGIKVLITTHSDYIVKELNTLIMLNSDSPYVKQIMEKEGYCIEELILADKIKVYIAETKNVLLPGNKRKTPIQTLVPADIDPRMGIEASSFDTTIDDMNRIQEELYFVEEAPQ